MPSELKDVAGYRALIEPLLGTVDVPDWMDRHRFLLRDKADMPALSRELRESRNDRVLVLDLELDNAHVMSSLAQAAIDPALPADERMQALIQLGGIDMALGRHAEALEKYGVGFNYHSQTGNRPMQCLCLTSAADTLRKSGDPESALERYQQSLALSVEERSPPLIRAGVHGAGLCCLDLARFEEAEGYFEHSNRLSGKLYDPYAKADALELLGAARYARGNRQGAFDAWLAGKGLAQQFGYEHRAVAILERLAAACDEQGESSRADVFRRERDALGASHEHKHGSEAST
jgi:tetratricopeptide (TPR) repeat protein